MFQPYCFIGTVIAHSTLWLRIVKWGKRTTKKAFHIQEARDMFHCKASEHLLLIQLVLSYKKASLHEFEENYDCRTF